MKYIYIVFMLALTFTATIIAQETETAPVYYPFSTYKPNYMIMGNREDQVKIQFSFKYEFIEELGFFFGYRQIMFWDFYEISSPFTDINFNPDIFWIYGSGAEYFKIGFYEHKSNGKDSISSRSWDRSYAQFAVNFGETINTGFNLKTFYMWRKAEENKDIEQYTGFYEAEFSIKALTDYNDRLIADEEIYLRFGTGMSYFGFDTSKGWLEAGLKFRMIFRSIQPHIFIQLYHGYGESLIDYNQFNTALRVGVYLVNSFKKN